MLILTDPQWWVEHPDELAGVLEEAVNFQSEEPKYRGPMWFGHDRARMAGEMPASMEPGDVLITEPERYAGHPEEFKAALEIQIAIRRQREAKLTLGDLDAALRDPPDHEPPPDDRGRGR